MIGAVTPRRWRTQLSEICAALFPVLAAASVTASTMFHARLSSRYVKVIGFSLSPPRVPVGKSAPFWYLPVRMPPPSGLQGMTASPSSGRAG